MYIASRKNAVLLLDDLVLASADTDVPGERDVLVGDDSLALRVWRREDLERGLPVAPAASDCSAAAASRSRWLRHVDKTRLLPHANSIAVLLSPEKRVILPPVVRTLLVEPLGVRDLGCARRPKQRRG
jgi:hypothetical protein